MLLGGPIKITPRGLLKFFKDKTAIHERRTFVSKTASGNSSFKTERVFSKLKVSPSEQGTALFHFEELPDFSQTNQQQYLDCHT